MYASERANDHGGVGCRVRRRVMQRVRIGVIGVGLFGGRHVAALSDIPYVDVAALPDPDAARLGVVGTRQCAGRYVAALGAGPDVDVAALADLDGARLGEVATRYGVGRRYADGLELAAD